MNTVVSRGESGGATPTPVAAHGLLQVSVHSGGREIVALHAREWNALCDRARADLAFIRPALVSAFLDTYSPNDQVVLLMARYNDELIALLPLVEKSIGIGPFRTRWLRTASQTHFQRHDVIHVDEKEQDAIATAFWRELRAVFPRHLMHLETVLTDGVLARMGALAAEEGCLTHHYNFDGAPYMAIPPVETGMEGVIAAQGKSLRGSLRRGLRRLGEQGDLRFVYVENEAEGKSISEWVEQLRELEHMGWKGAAGSSINSSVADSHFYSRLARDEDLRPHVRCMALMLDEEMIAADIGFLIGDTYFGDKMTMNETYRDCSPGHLLHLFLLLECARRGVTTLNLGGIIEPYKMFWTDKTLPFSTIFIFPEGLRGRLFRAGIFDVAVPARNQLRALPRARQTWRAMKKLRASLALGGGID